MTKIVELFGHPTADIQVDWSRTVKEQGCPFLDRKCLKTRKSQPSVSIGTCTLAYGKEATHVVTCPIRLLQQQQVFTDCIHLLTSHEPGNELRVISELSVPGGSIDYCLVSVRDGAVRDLVGIELQTLDTTGTVWPERQRFLAARGVKVLRRDVAASKSFGMNWKMTAKTILMQLHHKVETFAHIGKRLVLVAQDCLVDYISREFAFDHMQSARLGDPFHLHAYRLLEQSPGYRLQLKDRRSTDVAGIARCLGLQAPANIELEIVVRQLESKLPSSVPLAMGSFPSPANRVDIQDE